MKAIKIASQGEADVLKLSTSEPMPKPASGQVLVRIHAAGVNFVDIYQRRGSYPQHLPFIPGLEAAGVVEEVGPDVTGWRPGDRVGYTGKPGSYAEFNAVEAWRLIRFPADLPFLQAAAVPLQGMTAHYLTHEFRKPGKGDTVLIHAAAGGVGRLLVQWSKHLGATVIATVSTKEKEDVARAAGADHVILYNKVDFAPEARKLTEGRGVQLVLDGVAKTTFAGDLEAVAIRGHVVIFGAASGPADPLVPNSLMQKSISLSGGSLMNYATNAAEVGMRSAAVFAGIREGWLKLKVDTVLPLAEAAQAHRLLEGRNSTGKIVLKVAE
jgi:NADPH2:quinone reductase